MHIYISIYIYIYITIYIYICLYKLKTIIFLRVVLVKSKRVQKCEQQKKSNI